MGCVVMMGKESDEFAFTTCTHTEDGLERLPDVIILDVFEVLEEFYEKLL